MPVETLWFAIISAMLAMYVVLDGFDFGVGILHRLVAKTDTERRTVLAAIGPVWDGNEVWLIASGGVLFMAFPKVYATAFSGFYMALMIVLWLLILRGVAIEFRSHNDNPLWRDFWDTVFVFASGLLALVFGAALGNLVRGVPLQESGLAGMPLFTNFVDLRQAGLFDWYTLLVGLFALATLAAHGALYLDWRTAGPVQERSRQIALRLWTGLIPCWVVVTLATAYVQPEIFPNLLRRVGSLPFVALAFGGFAGVFWFLRRDQPRLAFLSSSSFLLSVFATTMIANYPNWLRSTLDPAASLTVHNAAASSRSLTIALLWWIPGILLVTGYFTFLYRSLQGKVSVGEHAHH